MVRLSNALVGIVNTISLMISLAAIGSGFYFYLNNGSDCQKFLQNPLLITGSILFLVSLLGMVGSFCRVTFIMYIYLTLMFLLILFFIFYTAFVVFVTNEVAGKAIAQKGYKEYKMEDYSHWLQQYLINGKNWHHIKSCLIAAQICTRLGNNDFEYNAAANFYQNHMSPIQAGCCKPPSYCKFEMKNATFWKVPKSGPAVKDSDCTTWSNNQLQLCYDCKSCKGGMIGNIRKKWKHIALLNVSFLLVIVLVYSIGCCAKRSSSKSDKYNRYRGNP